MSQESPPHSQPPFDVPSVEEMSGYLPQFVFEKLAAFGGMGAVFKARQASLDRPVAIKVLPPQFGSEEEFAERFKSEARAMAKLNHTNIVGVYDFGITKGGHLYLVMEWVEGGTLHDHIHKGVLPVRRAAALAMQLCEALTYAHSHHILHRDIKPGNIMINQEDQVKVADFGLARRITGEAEENPYGTPDYAAPEILGGGAVDQRVDIYAAGIVLYEMLTGHVPKSPRRSVTEYAPVSKRWDTLIDRATHPDPEKRFHDALEFRAHIRQVMNQSSEAVAVAVVEEAPAKKGGLKPLHYGLIGAAVLVVAAVLGLVFKSEPEKRAKKPRVVAEKSEEGANTDKSKKKPQAEIQEKPGKVEKAAKAKAVAETPEPPKKKPQIVKNEEPKMAAPPTASTPEPSPPAPERVQDVVQNLETRDPELARLVTAFGDEWSANPAIDTEAKVAELAGKYIPALQRSLAGLMPEQRDHVLSEISHIANHETLNDPVESWPPVLKTLRDTYNGQVGVIEAQAAEAANNMRAAQCELLKARAKERAAAGNEEGARLAEFVAEVLGRLEGRPSLKALKQSAVAAGTDNPAPVLIP